jgi:hypothetical protein
MKGAKTVWRDADPPCETAVRTQDEPPESDSHHVPVKAYSRRSPARTANPTSGRVGAADAPQNALEVESLAEGPLPGLQSRRDEWN